MSWSETRIITMTCDLCGTKQDLDEKEVTQQLERPQRWTLLEFRPFHMQQINYDLCPACSLSFETWRNTRRDR